MRARPVQSRLAGGIRREPQRRGRARDTARQCDPQRGTRDQAPPAHVRRSALGALALLRRQQLRGALDDRRRLAQIDSPDRDPGRDYRHRDLERARTCALRIRAAAGLVATQLGAALLGQNRAMASSSIVSAAGIRGTGVPASAGRSSPLAPPNL